MLTMTMLVGGILLGACVVAFAIYLLLAQQKSGQHHVDVVALSVAEGLNKDDKVGQMNNVVARCRELVYTSRVNDDAASALRNSPYTQLAHQLLDESRASALFVEQERKNEMRYIINATRDQIYDRYVHTKTSSNFSLPWFETYEPEVTNVYLGYIDKVQSNVLNTDVLSDLRDFDKSKKYFEPQSNLYLGNINAKLPSPDSDLDFKISSLPADVDKSVAPPRLANPEVFKNSATVIQNGKFVGYVLDQLPSSVQVQEKMNISIKSDQQSVQLGAVATTNGAQPAP